MSDFVLRIKLPEGPLVQPFPEEWLFTMVHRVADRFGSHPTDKAIVDYSTGEIVGGWQITDSSSPDGFLSSSGLDLVRSVLTAAIEKRQAEIESLVAAKEALDSH